MTGARSWLVFCAVAAVVTGCGGGTGDRDTDASFQQRGQELCKRITNATPAPAPGDDAAALAANLRTAMAQSAAFYRELDALPAPDALEPTVQRVLALERRDDRGWRRVVARLDAGATPERALAPELAAITANRRAADRLYRKLGLTDCTFAALAKAQGR